MFTLVTELFEDSVARVLEKMVCDAGNAGLTTVDVLKKARVEAEKAEGGLAKITKEEKEIRESHNKGAEKVCEERAEEVVALQVTALRI